MDFELILKGGRVIDPSIRIDRIADIGINKGSISAITDDLSASSTEKTLNCNGLIVCPGLIDIHVHVADCKDSPNIQADTAGVHSGVTTIADAGTYGVLSLPAAREAIRRDSKTRVLFIVRTYLLHSLTNYISERVEAAFSQHNFDLKRTVQLYERYEEEIVGFKCGTPFASESDSESIVFENSLKLVAEINIPLTVHIGTVPHRKVVPVPKILSRLRQGDIATHVYRRKEGFLDESGCIYDDVYRAKERGVIFDVGHGTGSFDFNTAKKMIEQGIKPDTISSDLTNKDYISGPVYSLTEVMNKFLHLGLSLGEVIEKTTINAAKAIRRENLLGSLAVGRQADISIFTFGFSLWKMTDGVNIVQTKGNRLSPKYSIRAGELFLCDSLDESVIREARENLSLVSIR